MLALLAGNESRREILKLQRVTVIGDAAFSSLRSVLKVNIVIQMMT